MNTFGRMIQVSVFGESHGEAVGAVISGIPAGIALDVEDFRRDLDRRKGGAKGTTARAEADIPHIKSGVFNGKTTGSPLLIIFDNTDADSGEYASPSHPRPGHADFTSHVKYGGFADYRGGGHFSGRLTVGLVAAGVIAKKIISPVTVSSELLEVGGSTDFDAAIDKAAAMKDSVGGLVSCRAENVPSGLGEPFFDSVESLISHIVFAIPGIKGIEFGAGFRSAAMMGSENNDLIIDKAGQTATNNSGGVSGGVSNGNDLVFRVAVKPTPSIGINQETTDMSTGGKVKLTLAGRYDTCIALRVPPILEAVTAIVLADLMMMEQKVPRVFR